MISRGSGIIFSQNQFRHLPAFIATCRLHRASNRHHQDQHAAENKNPLMRLLYLPVLLLLVYFLPAQTPTRQALQDSFSLLVSLTHAPIAVDGDLSEPVWQTAAVATNFYLKWPRDDGYAPAQTEVRCASDQRYVYFAFTCWHQGPLRAAKPETRRRLLGL